MDDNNLSINILSEITTFSKYRKYIPEINRRETWEETCHRYGNMMISRFPQLKKEIEKAIILVINKKVLPSMRMLQFAGKAVELNNARGYNCAYLPIDNHLAFSETMFLLLSGCGVGYSVQYQHVAELQAIKKPKKSRKFVIADSLEGWSDSIKALMKAYFGLTSTNPDFVFSEIRPKGARLVTSGGTAPGPEPLKECIFKIRQVLESKNDGDKLLPIECHKILCYIANAVLAGGIRRAAMIALFSHNDEEMLNCKQGEWYVLNEQYGRANNSMVLERKTTTKEQFQNLWKKIEASNSGEPGIYFTNNLDYGCNPCCEISLRPFSFCNLSEINVSNIENEEDLAERVKVATLFGTMQATFTDFHYLRPIWRETSEADALIGIGMTGIASNKLKDIDLSNFAKSVKYWNGVYAKILGIKVAARTTTIKPSGTTSCVLGTSSGIHAWYGEYYIRRQRIGKNEALYTYLSLHHPELLEDDFFRPTTQSIISIPQKAPSDAILRDEPVQEFLERIKRFNIDWVREGHREGENTNNVSATVSIKNDEWESVGNWMWDNRSSFNGLSVLPYDSGSYKQAPFQEINEEQYNQLIKSLKTIDLSKVVEMDDNTNFNQEAACAGGQCSI